MEADVKANIEEAQKKQKLHQDMKHAARDLYTVGSCVLKISGGRSIKVVNWTTFGKVHS